MHTDTDETWSTVYISSNARDVGNCGVENNKCQTIDHALNQLKNSTKIRLILENSHEKSLVYPAEGLSRSSNDHFQLRILKANQEESNPVISGNDGSFIRALGPIDLFVDSVDFHDVSLINATWFVNQQSSISLTIQNSLIQMKLRKYFIMLNQSQSNVNITLQDCRLISQYDHPWLSMSMIKASNFRSTYSTKIVV